MLELLDYPLLDLPVRQWLWATGAMLAVFAGLWLLLWIVRGRLAALAKRTTTDWDDVVVIALGRTKAFFLFVTAIYIGARSLLADPRIVGPLQVVFVLLLLWQAGLWASSAIGQSFQLLRQRRVSRDPAAATTFAAMSFIAKLLLWTIVILLALDNVGVEVTALVAGLGIGGIAIALAVQSVLGDLLASLSIVLDKPFVIGDFVIVGEFLGSVEHVGLKTTRIRSLSGEQLVFSNSDLLQSRLRNYGRMYERRVVFEIGVTYQTPREKLKKIPDIIRGFIESQEQTRFDRSHFKSYGDSALLFESVYYVLVPDYAKYMEIQQAVNLGIHETFENEGIEFAYPTRTLFIENAASS